MEAYAAAAAKGDAVATMRAYDIISSEFHRNPFPVLDGMRADGPIVRVKLPIVGQTWLAVTHEPALPCSRTTRISCAIPAMPAAGRRRVS